MLPSLSMSVLLTPSKSGRIWGGGVCTRAEVCVGGGSCIAMLKEEEEVGKKLCLSVLASHPCIPPWQCSARRASPQMGGTKRKEDTGNAAPSLLHPKRLDGNGRLVALVAAALALIRTGGGNSSNEEESCQIAEIATVKNCVLLRVCRTSAAPL